MNTVLFLWLRISVSLLCLTLLTGCPRHFDPRTAPAAPTTDPQLAKTYQRAQQLFEAGELATSRRIFEDIASAHPPEPVAAAVDLYRARIALRHNEPARAHALLESRLHGLHDPALEHSVRYYFALSCIRTGRLARGRDLLHQQLDSLDSHSRMGALLALGYASASLGEQVAAVRYYDRAHSDSDRPAEKQLARAALTRLVWHELQDDQLGALETVLSPDGLAFALLTARLINNARRSHDSSRADALARKWRDLHRRHGLDSSPVKGKRQSRLVGLLLPRTGRWRAAGQLALRGAAAAAGVFERDGGPALQLVLRDSSADPAGQAEQLIAEVGVGALFGVFEPKSAQLVAAVAQKHRVPFLTIGGSNPLVRDGSTTFQLAPDNNARAKRLATIAVEREARRGAILAPDTPFGRQMTRAFGAAFTSAGGRVVGTVTYPASARSFGEQAKRLARFQFDALFVPDTARRLALITPALALEGMWSTPAGTRPPQGRRIQLLATADGLRASSLGSAARYLQAALLAPGYFPDEQAPISGALARDYRSHSGEAPQLVEAFAFDGIYALRQAAALSSSDPMALGETLRRGSTVGLTGLLRFGPDGRRTAAPLLYQVRGKTLTQLP